MAMEKWKTFLFDRLDNISLETLSVFLSDNAPLIYMYDLDLFF